VKSRFPGWCWLRYCFYHCSYCSGRWNCWSHLHFGRIRQEPVLRKKSGYISSYLISLDFYIVCRFTVSVSIYVSRPQGPNNSVKHRLLRWGNPTKAPFRQARQSRRLQRRRSQPPVFTGSARQLLTTGRRRSSALVTGKNSFLVPGPIVIVPRDLRKRISPLSSPSCWQFARPCCSG
jgi:hypothetical protein